MALSKRSIQSLFGRKSAGPSPAPRRWPVPGARFAIAAAVILPSIVAAGAYQPEGGAGIITTMLNVRKHSTAVLTEANSAAIIAESNSYLTQCNAKLGQGGGVADAPTIPSTINSQADISAACSAMMTGPAGITRRWRVVNAINWCGGPTSPGSTILGCAPTPGTCVILRRWTNLEGQILAHEFGHSKGLPHRSDSSNALMYPSIDATHTQLNASECSAIRQVSFTAEGPPNPQHASGRTLTIEEFVAQVYPEGIPMDEAERFTGADVAKVAPWLKDNSRAAYWANIAAVIGIVSDKDAYPRLRELILRPGTGKLPIEQYDGRVAAIRALGWVVRHGGPPAARSFLESHVAPEAWSSVPWLAPYHVLSSERDVDLAAVTALALSTVGDSRALQVLQRQLPLTKRLGAKRSTVLRRAIEQAIADARRARK